MLHFLIVQLGSQDLMTTALASIERFAGECNVDIVKLPDSTTDPRAHGQAIDDWRKFQHIAVKDVVVVMDPDVVLLSERWRIEVEAAFASGVGIWGAGNQHAWGPRVHAHMMVISGSVFNSLERSFTPCLDVREQDWRDTGGLYCMWARAAGWKVRPVEQGRDWHGVSAGYSHPAGMANGCRALWAHLGGGSHSDVKRMTWRQQYLSAWRRREIAKRKRFLRAAHTHLSSHS